MSLNGRMPAFLLEQAGLAEPQAWIGREAPFSFSCLDPRSSSNFRISPGNHQRFAAVWIYEVDLATLEGGRAELLLDESLRMLRSVGRLIIRHTQNERISIFSLKSYLGRRYGVRVSVEYEEFFGKEWITVYNVQRRDVARYQSGTWTIGLLTQGARTENMRALFESVRRQDPDHRHEILVCGPKLPEFAEYGLTYLDTKYREDMAEICRKKNDLAKAASHDNLCLLHDRYRLQDDFFSGFDSYGYDFDFVTIPQWYECGTHFPGYCALPTRELVWGTPFDCRDLDCLLPTQYINGGLVIAKTKTLRDVPFNELIFWQQAEDVELARALRSQSIPPRINVHSSAVTMGITPDYTKAIVPFWGSSESDLRSHILRLSLWKPGKTLEKRVRPWFRLLKKSS